jgi:radical SAM protein
MKNGRAFPLWDGRRYVFAEAPVLIYLELTRACDLACRHCRAEAIPNRHPLELSTAEVASLIADLGRFPRRPHLVLTGGDPLKRPDLFEILAEARRLGQPVSVTPSGTYALTPAVVGRLREAGVASLALSLDGSDPAHHDGIRGVPGSFAWTVRALRAAVDTGLPVQVNTLVCRETVDDLPRIYGFLTGFPIVRWSLFFLIRVGRGRVMTELSPARAEELMGRLLVLSRTAPFEVKLTEAHHYRRLAIQRAQVAGRVEEVVQSPVGRGFGIRDGNGIVFVSHIGNVFPSGFLPVRVGNVRQASIVDLYREAPLLRALRNPDGFYGKCGRCEFREICGGSRARAYALTGNPLASDPLCPYRPGRAGVTGPLEPRRIRS